jgi:hypothetical protein
MQHNGFVSSACGELLLRLTKPMMARMLDQIRRGGEDGDCRIRSSMSSFVNFLCLEVFSVIVPGCVSFLEGSRSRVWPM